MSNLVPKNLALAKYTLIVPYLLPDRMKRMIVVTEQCRRSFKDSAAGKI